MRCIIRWCEAQYTENAESQQLAHVIGRETDEENVQGNKESNTFLLNQFG